MQADPLSSPYIVADPRMAAVFASSRQRRMLLQFTRRARSLTEVANAAGYDLKRLHHHVGRLCDLGLLRVVGQRARAGRPVRLYRAVADSFFVEGSSLPQPFGAGLALELRQALARDADDYIEGMTFWADEQDRPLGRVARTDKGAVPAEQWRILRLRTADAEQLKAELAAVLTRYEACSGESGRMYLIHAAVVPRIDAEGPLDNPE